MGRKTGIAVLLAAMLLFSLAAGCSSNSNSNSGGGESKGAAPTSTPTQESTTSVPEKKNVTLKFAMSAKDAAREDRVKLLELAMEKTGYKVEPLIIPGDAVEFDKKLLISMMAGEDIDVLYMNGPTAQKYVTAQVLLPLDDMIAEEKYNADEIYGSNLKKFDGKIYNLPAFKDVHVTMYNKTLFDNAGIPYPEPGTWTWEKYLETAQKLTDPDKGIYGSYMLDWDIYFTLSAKQKKVPAYKEDGTSNLDDPAWAESLKFFSDLGTVHKVQPDLLTFLSKKLPFDAFMNGKYGMWVVGNWALAMGVDKKTYPRDWKLGVTIMPQVEAGEKVTLSVMGGYAVGKNTKHAKEAYEVVKALAELEYTLPFGKVPARVDLDSSQLADIAKGAIVGLTEDGITEQDIIDSILDAKLDAVDEKITGPGMTQINGTIIPKESELYAIGQRSLEDTMKAIKEKADNAIKEDQLAAP